MPEEKPVYRTMAQKLRAEGFAESFAEGFAEESLRTKVNILLRLLEQRFGPLPHAAQQRVRQAHRTQLDSWLARICDAQSIDDTLADG